LKLHTIDHIMQSHTSNAKHTTSASHTSPTLPSDSTTHDHQRPITASEIDLKLKWRGRQNVQSSLMMVSDPEGEDGSSSDTHSFDEDDMYGIDTDVETINLSPHSNTHIEPDNEPMVSYFNMTFFKPTSHFEQVSDLITQLDRMAMNMQDATLMVQALCQAEDIDVSSITDEAPSQLSNLSSSDVMLDILPQSDFAHDDNGCVS
jgi:hypothetical protein